MTWLKKINIICLIIVLLQFAINLFFKFWKGDFILDYFFNVILIVVSVIALILSSYLWYIGENNILITRQKKTIPDSNILDDSM